MIHVPKCVAALVSLTADEHARYSMMGVRVKAGPASSYRLEATDGRVLGIICGVSNPTEEDQKDAEQVPEPEALLMEAIVPAKHLTAALKQLGKSEKHRGQLRQLGIVLARPEILLVAGSTVGRCLPVDGRFPDVSTVLPKTPAIVSFRVNGDYLIELVKAALAVARTDGEKCVVEVLFWNGTSPIGVIAQGADGLTFDGLIMPCT